MATFVVTNTADRGAGSLRDAIAKASASRGADTITFKLADGARIELTSGELRIDDRDGLTIDGDLDNDGDADIIIDANGNDRVFNIDNDERAQEKVTLDGLVLTGGRTTGGSEHGGGLRVVEADLTLTNVVIDGNSTSGSSAKGGGLYVLDSTVTAEGLTITDNATGGSSAGGGGAYIKESNVTITDGTISNNDTTGSGAQGGGLHAVDSSIDFDDSTLAGNATTGVTASGGAIFANGSDIELKNSTLSGNSTRGDEANGGAIDAFVSDITLTGSTVNDNATAGANADGGAIAAFDGKLTLSSSAVQDNKTTGSQADGGGLFFDYGVFDLQNSDISGNSTSGAFADGGGVYVKSSYMTVDSSNIGGNSTAGKHAEGGGLYAYASTVIVKQSSIVDNSTIGDYAGGGGALFFRSHTEISKSGITGNSTEGDRAHGGAILADLSSFEIDSSTVEDNSNDGIGSANKSVSYYYSVFDIAANGIEPVELTTNYRSFDSGAFDSKGDPDSFVQARRDDFVFGQPKKAGKSVELDVLGNDTAPDNYISSFSLTIIDNPAHGTAEVRDGMIYYTPDEGYEGADRISYNVADGNRAYAGETTVNLYVDPSLKKGVFRVPDANSDSFTIDSGDIGKKGAALDILANDSFGGKLNKKSLILEEEPDHGSVKAKKGMLYFKPDDGFTGTETIKYALYDKKAKITSDEATVTIKVNGNSSTASISLDDLLDAGETILGDPSDSGAQAYSGGDGTSLAAAPTDPDLDNLITG